MQNFLGIGIVEGFFGPEWSWEARNHFCENLSSYGGDFYIYAPKRDSYLRKNWTQNHPTETWGEIKKLSLKCFQENIEFGIGLSPFEIHNKWNQQAKQKLHNKISHLSELNFNYLGLFFDDMKGSADLADIQIEIVEYIKTITNKTILFCPTYYSYDPILDKVFGQRAADYLEKIGTLSRDIQIFWTGSKVIPNSISGNELGEVAQVLKRKPLIWDNYFANDGPKQCKFLKLKPLEGSSGTVLKSSAGWAFNLMNQPKLSELVFSASVRVLKYNENPMSAFDQVLLNAKDSKSLKTYMNNFVEVGLDGIDMKTKIEITSLLNEQGAFSEIRDWLKGKYSVGNECLTD